MDKSAFKKLVYWISERQRIYDKKSAGAPKPWTNDEILRDNKFCNVYREQDKTTVWIAENWRTPHADHVDLWFAMLVARLINNPDSLKALGVPLPWSADRFLKRLKARRGGGAKVFSGAYIVSTNGVAMDKLVYLATHVLTPIWEARKTVRPRVGDTLDALHKRLTAFNGVGSFIGAQVVADMKYVAPLASAADWWSFASSGPGSRRGLNRIMGRPVDASWSETEWRRALCELGVALADDKKYTALRASGALPTPIHCQDLQNCLCEFDKYMRCLNGEGRMKATYNGRGD